MLLSKVERAELSQWTDEELTDARQAFRELRAKAGRENAWRIAWLNAIQEEAGKRHAVAYWQGK